MPTLRIHTSRTVRQKREAANRHWTNIINATRKVRGLEPLPPIDAEEVP